MQMNGMLFFNVVSTSGSRTLASRVQQVAAFQEVMRGGDVMLASHTGSGKTLAYLLPLVRFHAYLCGTRPKCHWPVSYCCIGVSRGD